MKSLAALLKPNWRKVLATTLMLAFLAAAYIQSYAFVDDVPGVTKPPLYDLLRPFAFWSSGMLLIMPLALLSTPLQWLGLSPLSSPLIWPLQVVYVYLLSCLLVFAHDRWGTRIERRWRWLVLILPFLIVAALWAPAMLAGIRSPRQMMPFLASSIFFSSCVLSLYVYTTVCIGVGVYRGLRK